MKIRSISAKNFRTLQDFNVKLGRNYCAISGKNNSGKSSLLYILNYFFNDREGTSIYAFDRPNIDYNKDVTQWSSGDINISVEFEINRVKDAEVFFVVETFNSKKIEPEDVNIVIEQVFTSDGESTLICTIGGRKIEGRNASEILRKFRSASNLILHNSTSNYRRMYFGGNSYMEVLEAHFSAEERRAISLAEKSLESKVRKAARQHKEQLDKILGKLNDKYRVELSSIDRGRSSRFPLEIKLNDKSVEMPLGSWGAGTQNRTWILLSVLDAIKIRSSADPEDSSTPVFLVEEPESFLHPSAQAEFGQLLNSLAEEFDIQIIATTHSPYLLNQNDPSANVLLERRMHRNVTKETTIRDTNGADWMLPFAENLGVIPKEFENWRKLFGSQSNRLILVEGDIDKEYFEEIKSKFRNIYQIPADVEILPYGGKDALKNSAILQFMIRRFGRVYITFDLDAVNEIRPSLERIGLIDGKDFCSIGQSGAGMDCIEGLLPEKIKKAVYSNNLELVSALASQDTKARNNARSQLKKALLTEFKSGVIEEKELQGFKSLFALIKKSFENK